MRTDAVSSSVKKNALVLRGINDLYKPSITVLPVETVSLDGNPTFGH